MVHLNRKNVTHKPNEVPYLRRVVNILYSIILIVYGGYGVIVNDLALPAKHSGIFSMKDEPALIMYVAFLCASLVMISEVVDHFDRRQNEQKYQLFAKVFMYLGWSLLILSGVLHVFFYN